MIASRPRRVALGAEALACLALARALVILLPFRVLARRLGARMGETPEVVAISPAARDVGWGIGAAAARSPWRSKCLEQAIAAKMMLRRRGIHSTLYLGVTSDPIAAHAWVRVGDWNVTGGQDVSRYAVVASFADVERS
jgi:hypothetical protein